MQTLSWFQEHIWQTIYRNPSCPCRDCVRVESEWLVVMDDNHAQYLFDVQNDYGCEGNILNYRDKL